MNAVDVVVTGTLPGEAMERLGAGFRLHPITDPARVPEVLSGPAGKARALVAVGGRVPVDARLIDALPDLELISNFGVGYDAVDAAHAARRGIIVTNTPDVLTEEVADLAIGLLISTVRELPQADRYLRAGRWLEKPYPLTTTLRTRSIGIFGLGRIGKAIARRIEAFGLPIAYHGRNRQPDVAYPFHDTLAGLARAVDTLICVAPGGEETRGMIGAEVLAALGPDGILINVGRGTTVDEAALIEALANGTIRSAGLDVFADEPRVPAGLMAMEHIVLLPHVGSGSVHTRAAMAGLCVDNVEAWFSGRGPLTPVAETPWPKR